MRVGDRPAAYHRERTVLLIPARRGRSPPRIIEPTNSADSSGNRSLAIMKKYREARKIFADFGKSTQHCAALFESATGMNVAAAMVYWAVVAVWLTILGTIAVFYVRNPRAFATTRLLLAVLSTDTFRNGFENISFGLYFGAQYGIFSAKLARPRFRG